MHKVNFLQHIHRRFPFSASVSMPPWRRIVWTFAFCLAIAGSFRRLFSYEPCLMFPPRNGHLSARILWRAVSPLSTALHCNLPFGGLLPSRLLLDMPLLPGVWLCTLACRTCIGYVQYRGISCGMSTDIIPGARNITVRA
ncbi:hypothetical protein M431DRAFT_398595 [Trichoderma harzianum CBS 226.95]|jgi:hypothetical protein|uniref:Uncharacterized protein n=1 Tax=Trichoderma harzianum CBS 226.95 TaxID=983964 RepID=A0A2T4AE90_TRIHA|nr:hypothetical protein M431DRAFT_398595 [Trichoderma harzianum CBS 226.95]PTB55333.1 hypothetical protein M431DRAFT_398595 [Trichoderma harzianum CBS 226.95]